GTSEAVTVELPLVLSVTLKLLVPPASAAFGGRTALLSLEVMATVSFVLIKFQFASTALTVTLNAVPAIWAMGVPVLPVGDPGAAVSPGRRICSLAKAPAMTGTAGEVFAALLPSERSEAVTMAVLLRFTLNVCVPAARAALG